MRYLSFIKHPEPLCEPGPPKALLEAMEAFVKASFEDGSLVDTGGLRPTEEGFRIRLDKGELTVTDGPFAEAKEVIGGWGILEVGSREEAVAFARRFMEVHRKHWPEFVGECEVRPMFDPGMGPKPSDG